MDQTEYNDLISKPDMDQKEQVEKCTQIYKKALMELEKKYEKMLI